MSGVQAVEGCMNRFTGRNQPEAIRHREAIRLPALPAAVQPFSGSRPLTR
jgi:hypothetical protein